MFRILLQRRHQVTPPRLRQRFERRHLRMTVYGAQLFLYGADLVDDPIDGSTSGIAVNQAANRFEMVRHLFARSHVGQPDLFLTFLENRIDGFLRSRSTPDPTASPVRRAWCCHAQS